MTNHTSAGLVVVTGSGMGRGIALDQARQGHHVVLVGRRSDPLHETAAAIGDPDRSTVVAGDASTLDGVAALVTAVAGREVTGFVAVAGGQGAFKEYAGGAAEADTAWTDALRKNLFSAVLPIEALLPAMAQRQGRIVLIGSTAGLDGAGGPYATAKAALGGYGRDLAQRAGARGITVNTVAPGFVAATEFFESGGYGDSAGMIDGAAAQTLVGRVGEPADITAAVRWLSAPTPAGSRGRPSSSAAARSWRGDAGRRSSPPTGHLTHHRPFRLSDLARIRESMRAVDMLNAV